MAVDLLLDLDDDLLKLVGDRAAACGMANEEFVRKALMENTGMDYAPFDEAADPVMCPILHLDLRVQ